jgi:mannobiose 2-epimerase
MKKPGLPALLIIAIVFYNCSKPENNNKIQLASEIRQSLKEVIEKWYPLSVDTVYGGFLSSFTYDFKPTDNQDKMIVTQARHTWANAKAYLIFNDEQYLANAKNGFNFLKNVMWNKTDGGFYTMVSREGKPKEGDTIKTAYGNAFGIYALAAYYQSSNDTSALNFVKKAFMWLENGSHDPVNRGYFQHLNKKGMPIKRPDNISNRSDLGYKDQNSSIHLLEAFTELYSVWPDPLVKKRLTEMLFLIRDTIVTPKGNLTLFLQPDWTPISFQDSSRESILNHTHLDHVSFGHDVETAFLMLESSEILGLEHDSITTRIAKKMVDHALQNGWDTNAGGFYDEGYYFKNQAGIEIIRDTKNWWAQAEGLNALLLMADLYPDDGMNYYGKFEKQWQYCNRYLIDHENGDWFAGGLDKQPEMKTALKGHIWKANYHQFRSLWLVSERLRQTD